jgi:hypothetical protein
MLSSHAGCGIARSRFADALAALPDAAVELDDAAVVVGADGLALELLAASAGI